MGNKKKKNHTKNVPKNQPKAKPVVRVRLEFSLSRAQPRPQPERAQPRPQPEGTLRVTVKRKVCPHAKNGAELKFELVATPDSIKYENEMKDLELLWPTLISYVEEMYNRDAPTPRWVYIQNYTLVHRYCTTNQREVDNSTPLPGHELYNRLKQFITQYVEKLEEECADMNDMEVLEFYGNQFDRYHKSSKELNSICKHLNNIWPQHPQERSKDFKDIKRLSLEIWRDCGELNKRAVDAALKMIESVRKGEDVDLSWTRKIVECLVNLGLLGAPPKAKEELTVYQHYYEGRVVTETELYYRREYSKLLPLSSIHEYMDSVDEICHQEMTRCLNYIHWSTWNKLVLMAEFIFVFNHLDVFRVEFQKMIELSEFDAITRTYRFVERSFNASTMLREVLEKQVNEEAQQALKIVSELKLNNPINFFHAILKVLLKISHMMTLFDNNMDFIEVLRTASYNIVNSNTFFHPAELVANYCDVLLTRTKGVQNQEALELALSSAMGVFSFVADKDIFQNIYIQLLAKRIMFRVSISADAEMLIISKLKTICGCNYTVKMERMLQDALLSNKLGFLSKIAEFRTLRKLGKFDFRVEVMALSSYPFVPTPGFRIPRELKPIVKHYKRTYKMFYPQRSLKWLHSMSRGEIATNCFDRRYILQMNTFQMAVILLFNDEIILTFEQILKSTGIKEEILKQILGIFVRRKLLKCDAVNEDFLPSTELQLNIGFKSNKLRININVPMKYIENAEKELSRNYVKDDRMVVIKAFITCIMKLHGTISKKKLVEEVLQGISTRCKPTVGQIKECIDSYVAENFIVQKKNTYKLVPEAKQ